MCVCVHVLEKDANSSLHVLEIDCWVKCIMLLHSNLGIAQVSECGESLWCLVATARALLLFVASSLLCCQSE